MKKLFMGLMLVSLPVLSHAADNFYCSGNKPVWNLSVSPAKMLFKKADAEPIVVPGVAPQPAEQSTLEKARVYRSKAGSDKVTVIIKKGACTDGNKPYSYGVLTQINHEIFHGCCVKR